MLTEMGTTPKDLKREAVARVGLSMVIPIYNSELIFPELYKRLIDVLDSVDLSCEVVAVVDGCRDQSFCVIREHALRDPRIKVLEFSRNFGHQAAVTAGLEHATGDLVGIMDDDLEDPPEVLLRLLARLAEGYDVVYGIRRRRKRSLLHRFLYYAFYRVLGHMTDLNMPADAGDFCIMRRRVVEVLNAMPENNRYLRGMRSWVGFRQTGVEYDRGERSVGESGYSFRKYFALASTAIFSFSYKPLQYVSIAGTIVAFTSFLMAVYVVFVKLTGSMTNVPGWVSLLVAVLLLSGVQLISVGILGQYLMRIYDEVKKRPTYVIKRSVGFGEGSNDGTD
jgi:glycosyltransferase involved in cell wall biosynthesis